MRICFACQSERPDFEEPCPTCGNVISAEDGILQLAPWVAEEGLGWKSEYFSDLYDLEASSFWFQGRNKILTWAVGRYVKPLASFLEIGCGTGYVLAGLSRGFPDTRFTGSELFAEGLVYASRRLNDVELVQMDARRLPYRNEFDGIGAFDVLEHIAEDEKVLSEMFTALKPGGHVVLTVPQHPSLWSAADEVACHERRYARGELEAKVARAGFKVVRSTSFVFFLLPAMMASRWFNRGNVNYAKDPTAELRLPGWLNALFRATLVFELALMRVGLNFPAGGSRLVIARKAA